MRVLHIIHASGIHAMSPCCAHPVRILRRKKKKKGDRTAHVWLVGSAIILPNNICVCPLFPSRCSRTRTARATRRAQRPSSARVGIGVAPRLAHVAVGCGGCHVARVGCARGPNDASVAHGRVRCVCVSVCVCVCVCVCVYFPFISVCVLQ